MSISRLNPSTTDHLTQLAGGLFENLPIAIYSCDVDGYVRSYNKAAEQLLGRKPVIGEDLWCGSWKIYRLDGSVLPLDQCPMARALKEKKPIQGEEIIIERENGERINVIPYPVPIFDEGGELTGAINSLVDVTELRIGEARQARLAAIIESSDDAIISKTLQGIVTSWNEAAERMFGYSEKEAIGMPITNLLPQDELAEEKEIINNIRSGRMVEHYETIRIRKDGTPIHVSLTVSPVKDKRGQIIGASKIVRNIARQKASELKLKQHADNLRILNETGKAVSETLDADEILQSVTDATTTLTGAKFGAFFHNRKDLDGESYMLYALSGAPREAFEKFGMPRNTAVFNTTFTGAGVVRSDDITKDPRYGLSAPHHGMPKGHLPVVSYLAVPVVSKLGEVVGGLFFGHPEAGRFTEEHETLVSNVASQAAVALDNANLYEVIKKLNLKKDEFIGLASHELKTPMASLNGYLQIIDRDLPEADVNKPYIRKALSQVRKLSKLISDLLDVSKIDSGKLPFNMATFDLVEMATESIELVQYGTKSHFISLQHSENQFLITGDRQRLEQVLINLLTNAIKYSPKANKVIVTIERQGDNAVVSVEDFGIGIDEKLQDRIFSRFFRVEDLDTHISGLGIGLYISKEIIIRHNGRIWVDSQLKKGATFSFAIPVRL